MHIFSRF